MSPHVLAALADTIGMTCTTAYHEKLKADDATWYAGTVPGGIQPALMPGDPDGELGHCRRCRSTLARPLPAPGQTSS